MSATEWRTRTSTSIVHAVQTNVDTESPVTRAGGRADAEREKWQNLIDRKLVDWQSNPGQFDDDGVEPPSRETIGVAITVAQAFQEEGRAAPTRVVPDAHGGVVFERKEHDVFETIRVGADGAIEYCLFQDSRLVHRENW